MEAATNYFKFKCIKNKLTYFIFLLILLIIFLVILQFFNYVLYIYGLLPYSESYHYNLVNSLLFLPQVKTLKDKKSKYVQACNSPDITNKIVIPPFPPSIFHPFVGNMLGLGSLFFDRKCENSKSQSTLDAKFTMQLQSFEYTKHLWSNIYNSLMTSIPPHIIESIKFGKPFLQYQFHSKPLVQLTELHSWFYNWSNDLQKYIKIVPHNIFDLLMPIGLAHWIMDAGYISSNGLILCTECFTYYEVQILTLALISKFNLDATIIPCKNYQGFTMGYRICISRKFNNRVKLYKLVSPYFIPSMLHKINVQIDIKKIVILH
jgi:hypothetical protein